MGADNRVDGSIAGNSTQASQKDDSFVKVMSEAAGKNTDTKQDAVNAVKQSKPAQVQNKPRKDLKNDNTDSSDSADKAEKSSKTEEKKNITDDTNTKEDVSAKVSEKTEDIKDAVKDELSVSDEQLNAAMEALGFTELDLLNPDSIKELMLYLTENDDPMSLLTNETLLQSINNVIDVVNEVTDGIKQEFGLTDDALDALIKEPVKEFAPVQDLKETDLSEKTEDKPVLEPVKNTAAASTEPVKTEDKNETVKKGQKENTEGTVKSDAQAAVNVSAKAENAGNDTNPDSFNQNDAMSQVFVTTEIGSNGEVIESVREYSSYADGANIMSQVTEQIRVNISPETTTMEMQLHPASLGAVNVSIASENGVMHAHILVQNESVREVLASQMEQLLKTFEEQGQKVTEIDVSVANYNLEHGLYRDQTDGGQSGNGTPSRRSRRSIDLNAMSDAELSELTDEERLEAEMMNLSGTSVQYRA